MPATREHDRFFMALSPGADRDTTVRVLQGAFRHAAAAAWVRRAPRLNWTGRAERSRS